MDLHLKNKLALVIGASKGIGRSTAIILANEGAKVVAVARSKELLNTLEKENKNITGLVYDVIKDPTGFANEVTNKYGLFDIIVHVVGTSLTPRGIFEEWNTSLEVNALHQIKINSVLIPKLLAAKKKAHICHVSSISSKNLRGNPQYAASKEFLNSYITTTGRELAKNNIIVNGVMPGAVSFPGSYWDTAIKNKEPKVADFLNNHQAIGRFGTPEEIANLITFLVSDLADFTASDIYPIDGGAM